MQGGALLSQGGYGCVFSPSVNCKGRESSKKYISKIQKNDFSADNEIKIGKMVSKNKNYRKYFAPVIKSCPIDISKIKTKGLDDCKIITSHQNIQNFSMMKIRFINGSVLSSFITDNKNSADIFSNFVNIYQHMLEALNILITENVVHFDLKGLNVVFDTDNEKPIIIDFGLSIPVTELLKSKQYFRYFYIYAPDYYVWPLEVHFLNYIENIDEEPDMSVIKNLAIEFVEKNNAINKLSEHFKKEYINASIEELKKYLNLPSNTVKEHIMKHWKTWDNYSLSIMYLRYINILFGSDIALDTNNYIKYMVQIMLQNIHPNPNKRIPVKKNITMMENFFNSIKINQIDGFENLIREITINKKEIDINTLKYRKNMTIMTKKILNLRKN